MEMEKVQEERKLLNDILLFSPPYASVMIEWKWSFPCTCSHIENKCGGNCYPSHLPAMTESDDDHDYIQNKMGFQCGTVCCHSERAWAKHWVQGWNESEWKRATIMPPQVLLLSSPLMDMETWEVFISAGEINAGRSLTLSHSFRVLHKVAPWVKVLPEVYLCPHRCRPPSSKIQRGERELLVLLLSTWRSSGWRETIHHPCFSLL